MIRPMKHCAAFLFCAVLGSYAFCQDHPTIIVPSRIGARAYTKFRAIAFKMGVQTVLPTVYANEPVTVQKYRGIITMGFTYPKAVIHDFIRKGGRAFIQLEVVQGFQISDVDQIQEHFDMSIALETFPFTSGSFGCVPLWEGLQVIPKDNFPFAGFLIPGNTYDAVCSTNVAGRDRAIAARGKIGAGELIFLILPAMPPSVGGVSMSPFDDTSIDLFDNEEAARRTISWLARMD